LPNGLAANKRQDPHCTESDCAMGILGNKAEAHFSHHL